MAGDPLLYALGIGFAGATKGGLYTKKKGSKKKRLGVAIEKKPRERGKAPTKKKGKMGGPAGRGGGGKKI